VEIPGGELAQLGEMVRGVDVSGACFGTVALDEIVDGSAVQPGNVVIIEAKDGVMRRLEGQFSVPAGVLQLRPVPNPNMQPHIRKGVISASLLN